MEYRSKNTPLGLQLNVGLESDFPNALYLFALNKKYSNYFKWQRSGCFLSIIEIIVFLS